MNKKKIMGYTGLGYLALVMPRILHRHIMPTEGCTTMPEMRRKIPLRLLKKQ